LRLQSPDVNYLAVAGGFNGSVPKICRNVYSKWKAEDGKPKTAWQQVERYLSWC